MADEEPPAGAPAPEPTHEPQEAPGLVIQAGVVADKLEAQRALEMHQRREDLVAHSLAWAMVGGFLLVALVALLGFADVSKPPIAAFLGTVLGYLAARFDTIFIRYFGLGGAGESAPRKSPEEGPHSGAA